MTDILEAHIGTGDGVMPGDTESRRIRRVTVQRDRIVLAHHDWEKYSYLEDFERSALRDDLVRMSRLNLPWYSSQFSRDDAIFIKQEFPNRRVYFDGKEV